MMTTCAFRSSFPSGGRNRKGSEPQGMRRKGKPPDELVLSSCRSCRTEHANLGCRVNVLRRIRRESEPYQHGLHFTLPSCTCACACVCDMEETVRC